MAKLTEEELERELGRERARMQTIGRFQAAASPQLQLALADISSSTQSATTVSWPQPTQRSSDLLSSRVLARLRSAIRADLFFVAEVPHTRVPLRGQSLARYDPALIEVEHVIHFRLSGYTAAQIVGRASPKVPTTEDCMTAVP